MQTHPSTSRTPCVGWTVSNHILVSCPKTVRPGTHARYAKYHSTRCYNWTWHRRRDHLHLGDRYVKGEHTKQHSPKHCQGGWTIRDGVIAPCTELFTQGRTDKTYHSSECFFQTRRWRQLGYSLGDLVRRTCTYRNCKKGDGGARGTFDQIHRSKSGRFFCDPRCKAAENRACEADSITALRAQASLGKILEELKSKPLSWRRIIPLQMLYPKSTKAEVQTLAGTNLTPRQMARLGNWLRERLPGWAGFGGKELPIIQKAA